MIRVPTSSYESTTILMTRSILAALAASFLAAGCAADAETRAEPRAEREYQTGSNIPRKKGDTRGGGVTTVDREELERARAGSFPTGSIPKSN
jgi:hypothetical protein